MVTAGPFTSRTVPRRTLPETSGCPGLTSVRGREEETTNFPVDPEILTGTAFLKVFFRLSRTFLSVIACFKYSFSVKRREI